LDFHLYAVEWGPDEMRFYVDDKMYLQIDRGQKIKGNTDYLYPTMPFYWILNTTIAPFADHEDYSPLFNEFQPLDHLIDYVRVYERCDLSDAGCAALELPDLSDPHCALSRKYLGLYDDGRAVCRSFPHFKISEASCLDKGRFIWQGYCLKELDEDYVAREID